METAETTRRYCPMCVKAVTDETYDRFGEWCCSEAHAEESVREVRAQKLRDTTGLAQVPENRPARRPRGCC